MNPESTENLIVIKFNTKTMKKKIYHSDLILFAFQTLVFIGLNTIWKKLYSVIEKFFFIIFKLIYSLGSIYLYKISDSPVLEKHSNYMLGIFIIDFLLSLIIGFRKKKKRKVSSNIIIIFSFFSFFIPIFASFYLLHTTEIDEAELNESRNKLSSYLNLI